MKFVLFRHAQKGLNPFDDPELTESGFAQAEMLLTLVKKNKLIAPTHAWASPKIRTRQTLEPICATNRIKIAISDALDVRHTKESAPEFRLRIQKFLNQFEETLSEHKNETHFICTHYDWIEEAMTLINCDKDLNSFEFSHWSPSQFVVFEVQTPTWIFLNKGSGHESKIS